MQRGITLLLAMFCLTVCSVVGQSNERFITLEQILQLIDQYEPSLQTESSSIAIREMEQVQVAQSRLPDLNLIYQANVGSNNNVPGPYFGFGLVPTNNAGIRADSDYSATATNLGIAAFQWEFFNFGRYGAQDDLAEAARITQTERFGKKRYDVRSYAINHYLHLIRYQELREIQTQSVQRTEDIRQSIWALVKSGIRAGVDTSLADAEISRARLRGIEMDNIRNQHQIALAAMTGLDPSQIQTDSNMVYRLSNSIPRDKGKDENQAIHPWIAYRQAKLKQEEQRAVLINKSFRPKLFLSAALWGRAASVNYLGNYESLSRGIGLQRGNYLVGVGISYNIFDITRKSTQKNVQHAQVQQETMQLREAEVQLNAHKQRARADVAIAQRRLDELPRQVNAARAAYSQKFALYKNGLTDIVDVNIAQNLLYEAEHNSIDAKFGYYQALWRQAVAENQLDQFISLFK